MDDTEKRYALESDEKTISIHNLECGMRETILKADLKPNVLEFFNRVEILIKKELIGGKKRGRAG